MSLQAELKQLQAQKKQELRNLHVTYLRTKRVAARQLNPERIVRKHIGATLGLAAIAGMILAPRPAPRYTQKDVDKAAREAKKERGNTVFGHLAQLVKNALGQLENLIPAPKREAAAPSARFDPKTGKPTRASGLLNTLLGILLSRIDLTKIAAQVSQIVMHLTKKSPAAAHNGKHHEAPHVDVADAGTVKPTDYENFQ